MKNKAVIFTIITLLGCDPLPPDEGVFLPIQGDAVVLRHAGYVSHTTQHVVFTLDIIVLNSFYQGFDNDYLYAEDFHFSGQGDYEVEYFTVSENDDDEPGSCNLLLIDQSGSYLGIDPYNSRSQILGKYIKDVTTMEDVLVAASSREGELAQEPIEYAAQTFNRDIGLNRNFIFGLSARTGGESSIRDAMMNAIQKFDEAESACPGSRELVTLVHANDLSSLNTVSDVIDFANAEGVSIHTIAVGDMGSDSFIDMSTETGGIFASAPTVLEMNKLLAELDRLVNGASLSYRFTIKFTPDDMANLQSGSTFEHLIQIIDPFSGLNYTSLPVRIHIP